MTAFIEGLEAGGCSRDSFIAPQPASQSDVTAVHDPHYVQIVENICSSLTGGRLTELPTGDSVVCAASYELALLASGAAITAVQRATPGSPALSLARPPGHHATPTQGMGFCVFNNIAVAAQWARRNLGAVLIVDFDYHHGNGTQAWVERELGGGGPPLGFISTHAYPAYPGTGSFGESRLRDGGFVIDVPLPHSALTDDFTGVWRALLPPLAQRVSPAVIAVSAGFDFLAGDPIAGLPVAPRAVDALAGLLAETAAQTSAPLALIFEGGYLLDNLRAAAQSLARNLAQENVVAGIYSGAADAGSEIKNAGLRAMVDEVLGWLR